MSIFTKNSDSRELVRDLQVRIEMTTATVFQRNPSLINHRKEFFDTSLFFKVKI